MSNTWPWFERTFERSFPVAKMPEIMERLIGSPIRLEQMIGNVESRILQKSIDGQSWSILENAGHLSDLEPLWQGRIKDLMEGSEILREADLSNRMTHEANHNQSSTSELVKRFNDCRAKTIDQLAATEPRDWERTARHPRLGTPMRMVDLCHFVAEHDDYHLAKIRRLLNEFKTDND